MVRSTSKHRIKNRPLPIGESPILKKRQRAQRKRNYFSLPVIASISLCLVSLLTYFIATNFENIASAIETKYLNITQKLGFKVNSIVIQGQEKTPRSILNNAINIDVKASILKYNILEIKERLQQIDWIKDVIVHRQLPDQIYIKITEREPIAVWQTQKKLYLIDEMGTSIYIPAIKGYEHLPHISGQGAPEKIPELLKLLGKSQTIHENVSNIVRVRKRRWDIVLKNNIVVKLPENENDGPKLWNALNALEYFLKSGDINLDQIKTIDLRLANKYYIEKK